MFFVVSPFCFASEAKGLLSRNFHDKIIIIESNGSAQQVINGTYKRTKPEHAIYPWDKNYDWCSRCIESKNDHPWILFSLDRRKMKIKSYFIRAGCCNDTECCCDSALGYCSECCLYSWSLQISDDKKTWTEVHRVEKDNQMKKCFNNTYKLNKEYTTKYLRIIQNQTNHSEVPCIAINKFYLFGEIVGESLNEEEFVSYHDDDDDVSIVGYISRNVHMKPENRV